MLVRSLGVCIACALASCRFFTVDGDPGCDGVRWEVKTLSDTRADHVDFTPVDRTIAQLVRLPAVTGRLFGGRHDDELTVYRVTCEISGYMIEGDGDVHLVIHDPGDTAAHMIAEIPNPHCRASIQGGHAEEFAAAIRALQSLLPDQPPTSKFQSIAPAPVVEITGVGFYDIPHFQGGAARNDLELHPVLSLRARVR